MAWDLDAFIAKLYNRELLAEHIVKELCEKTKEVLVTEGNVRAVPAPCTLVGDIHGQFYDLLEIFKIGGYSPNTNYVFLGDYVDRGVTLVRGNHESRAVTQTYGFYAELTIENAIFGVHGGLSPSLHSIDQIRIIDRFREIPHEGPMADLVWSDPMAPTFPGSEDKGDFAISPRGAGYVFGRDVIRKFLEINGLGHICRAHQLCMEGYQILYDDMLSTVWSAPNYCYRAGNMASVLEIAPNLERYFNVFGPCPDQNPELLDRNEGICGGATLSQLLGLRVDGTEEASCSNGSVGGGGTSASGSDGASGGARRRRRNNNAVEDKSPADSNSGTAGVTRVVMEYFI
ncbi:hypothetical protein SeLEV6574_g05049 [Synchytrium endobioticum]|uniref:Serine/threonine-protein phosphatase n=1 Tax=Synchytrium endobioticum TaxID=286115 RepID=A0A507CWN5_9FUNG|nr:hypothetical protein SeLEV6574_g05049 [Synchytrium endobioticum]